MILSELVRRGRGERILIVTPRHVLEQMQLEMWTRFALPFVRLDSVGIQRVRQKLPATRNPFTYYKRVIISIDTLKSDQLPRAPAQAAAGTPWSSTSPTTSPTRRRRTTGSPACSRRNTEALILASAHPAQRQAGVLRRADPTARADRRDARTASSSRTRSRRLVIRRHRHSPEVASEVGADWAERKEPQNLLVAASARRTPSRASSTEVWLHPAAGASPYSGDSTAPVPLDAGQGVPVVARPLCSSRSSERIGRLGKHPTATHEREIEALLRPRRTGRKADDTSSAQVRRAARATCRRSASAPSSPSASRDLRRAGRHADVAARAPAGRPRADDEQVGHAARRPDRRRAAGRSSTSFKQASSPIRVLVTGDVASEGVNLHAQCHQLIHYDIPWSLIRIEQRNGRIDRYGQQPAADHHAAAQPVDRDVLRRPAGAAAA